MSSTSLTAMVAGNAMFSTKNLSDSSAWCPHCDNQGIVIFTMIDGELIDPETAGPCPMCEKGMMVNGSSIACRIRSEKSDGPPTPMGSPWRFWSKHNLAGCAWGHAYTSAHRRRCRFQREGRPYPCGLPAIEMHCNHHVDASNRVQVVAERRIHIPRLAVEAGPTMTQPQLEARKERTQNRLDLNERLEQAGVIDV